MVCTVHTTTIHTYICISVLMHIVRIKTQNNDKNKNCVFTSREKFFFYYFQTRRHTPLRKNKNKKILNKNVFGVENNFNKNTKKKLN